jgi:hypothetical protein
MRPPDDERRPREGAAETTAKQCAASLSQSVTYLCPSHGSSSWDSCTCATYTTSDASLATFRPLGRDWFLEWLNAGHESWFLREARWREQGRIT